MVARNFNDRLSLLEKRFAPQRQMRFFIRRLDQIDLEVVALKPANGGDVIARLPGESIAELRERATVAMPTELVFRSVYAEAH